MLRNRIKVAVALALVFVNLAGAADLALLKAQIEKELPRARGDVGVAIKHMESGAEIFIHADARYPMASAFKLPILVELYYQKSDRKLSLDDRVEIAPSDLHGAHEYKKHWATRFVPQETAFLFSPSPRAAATRFVRFGLAPAISRLASAWKQSAA